MTKAINLLWLFARTYLMSKAVQRLKTKGVLVYLRALQIARMSLAGALALFFVLQLMVVGFVGAIATGVWLIPQETETKLWILFGVFAFLFVIPFVGILFALSDRVWFEMSGARELVEKSDAE